ncbi:MAG TPA: PcfJ domain-containing protein [Limnobacter sp.]|nr:PcfJ domain-containing protein [Limnobacter sp.]
MRPALELELKTMCRDVLSIHRVRSGCLPVRFVNTRTGLFFEWNLSHRAKVAERAPLLLDDAHAWQLKMDLIKSVWRAPPSLKVPPSYSPMARGLTLQDICLKDLQRAWTQALIALHGKPVFNICLRVYPRDGTLLDLHRVAAHRVVLDERLRERPRMAPLLAQDPGMWTHLPNWQLLKRRMLAQGLSHMAWRWLNHQSPAYIARLDWGALSHIAWANFHAMLNRPLPVSWVDAQTAALGGFGGLSSWLRRNHENLATPQACNILRAVRLALVRRSSLAKRTHQKELESEEFPLIADWLLGSSNHSDPRISRHWTYDTLMSKQSHWHLVERDWQSGRPDVFWPQLLGMGDLGDLGSYIELSSLHALLSEAKRMHHCVPSYIDRCMDGDVCMFHLQLKGPVPQRATLEVRRSGLKGWAVSQLKGPCNAPVTPAMAHLAQALVARLA